MSRCMVCRERIVGLRWLIVAGDHGSGYLCGGCHNKRVHADEEVDAVYEALRERAE
jgi:hypothetical protein